MEGETKKTALRLTKSECSVPTGDLERYATGWLLDGQIRQLSKQTLAVRRFLMDKLLWFLRHRGYETCGVSELRAFLAYVGTAHESAAGRWGNPRLRTAVRPRTVHTYFGNLRTLFQFIVSEGTLELSPMEAMRAPVILPALSTITAIALAPGVGPTTSPYSP